MTNLARKTDPISSHIAGQKIKKSGQQMAQQKLCLKMLAKYGKGTRAEIAKQAANDKDHNQDYEFVVRKSMLGRRLPELARSGLIELVEIRRCAIANKPCQVWECNAIGAAAAAKLQANN